jgi:hypothetical protein
MVIPSCCRNSRFIWLWLTPNPFASSAGRGKFLPGRSRICTASSTRGSSVPREGRTPSCVIARPKWISHALKSFCNSKCASIGPLRWGKWLFDPGKNCAVFFASRSPVVLRPGTSSLTSFKPPGNGNNSRPKIHCQTKQMERSLQSVLVCCQRLPGGASSHWPTFALHGPPAARTLALPCNRSQADVCGVWIQWLPYCCRVLPQYAHRSSARRNCQRCRGTSVSSGDAEGMIGLDTFLHKRDTLLALTINSSPSRFT